MSYKCPFCNVREPSINWLRIHIRKCHDDGKPIICPACGYKARSLQGLIYHCAVRYDKMHQAIYLLTHRNTRTNGTKVHMPIKNLKQLKEVFRT